jgi:hypothetical protein
VCIACSFSFVELRTTRPGYNTRRNKKTSRDDDRHAFWVILGIAVLGVGFLDIFLTILDYDESGFLVTPLCALQWRGVRTVTRRLSRDLTHDSAQSVANA